MRRAAGRVPSSSRRPARQRTPRRRRSSRAVPHAPRERGGSRRCRPRFARRDRRERRPPPGGGGADSPRRELDLAVVEERDDDVDHVADDPEMLRSAPARFRHVVRGDILEIKGGASAEDARRRPVRAEPPRHRECPAGRGPRRHQLSEVDRVFQPGHTSIITAGAHAVDVPSFEGSPLPLERERGSGESLLPLSVPAGGRRQVAELQCGPRFDTGRRNPWAPRDGRL